MADMTPSDPVRSANWLAEILNQLRLVWALWRDPGVPALVKLILPAILAYLLLPVDLLPDMLVGLGQLDDLAVVLLGLRMFVALSPEELVRHHSERLAGRWKVSDPPPQSGPREPDTIEGQYRVLDEGQ